MTTVAAISTSDFLGPRDTQLSPAEINERIEIIQAEKAAAEQDEMVLDEQDQVILDQLIAFREQVEQITGADFGAVRIVPVDLFEDYARDVAEEAGWVSDELACYVDWPKFARSYMRDFRSLPFGEDLVLVRA